MQPSNMSCNNVASTSISNISSPAFIDRWVFDNFFFKFNEHAPTLENNFTRLSYKKSWFFHVIQISLKYLYDLAEYKIFIISYHYKLFYIVMHLLIFSHFFKMKKKRLYLHEFHL
jgi:hypothetical protein